MSDRASTIAPPQAAESEHWTARHGKPIIFVIVTLIASGIYLALGIPVSVFPSTEFPRIVIGVDNGVAPIDQMLVTVTRPIEEAVNSVQGLERVKSVTSRGTAEVDLYFSWSVNMFETLARVNAAVARAQSNLPPTAKVTADPLTFAAFPILGYSLMSDNVPQTRLWEIATYDLKPRLNRLNGVSTVVVQGGQEPEFEVRLDPPKMLQSAVTVPALLDALKRSNLIDSPGLIETNHQLVLSLVSGQARSPAEIAGIVVKTTPAGLPVRIGDIASVLNSVKPVYTVVTANGKPAVLLNIKRQPNGNTVQVADEVHAAIDELRKGLPRGVRLEPFYDQSEIVNDSIKSVRDAIFIGLVLASIILVIFLRDWGTSLVAGLVIPATVAITFIFLRMLGESFDLMTLGGLAAAVGLVIDDAIVVVENIVLHRDAGQSRAEAVRSAIREISKPLVGSTDSSREYDTYDGANTAPEDWIGYTFASPQTFGRVVFQEGMHFWDGGWFTTLTVQVRQAGVWTTVSNLRFTPAFPFANDGTNYQSYTLDFSAITGDGIRLDGAPGGQNQFISVGELEVYGPGG